jgi:hypothetical protein
VRLRDRRACQLLTPIVVVALRAGQVELALPSLKDRPAGGDNVKGRRVVVDGDREALDVLIRPSVARSAYPP